MLATPGFVRPEQWQAQIQALIQRKAEVLVHSALPEPVLRACHLQPCPDIGAAVQGVVEGAGFAVVRDLVGHGVGRAMHEDPQVRNYGEPGTGPELKPGTTLAIEPMITDGSYEIRVDDDGWSIFTVDDSLAAHFEHTVAITEDGPRILTLANGASIVDRPI